MRCLIIDDEPAARDVLRSYIADTEELQIVEECKDALEARKVLKEATEIDLIFLDINMPRLTGIEFLKSLSNPPAVILTTAYSEYALEGFELDVSDYLLKPFSFERFLKAIDKVSRSITDANGNEDSIAIKADGKLFRLPFDEILFVESKGDYLSVHTPENTITFYQTLKEFYRQLPGDLFTRIHRSYVVNISKIAYLEGNIVHLADHELPVGKSYKHAFMEKFTS